MVDKLKLGRPALSGERYPCGKRRPSDYRSDTQIRRLIDSGLAATLDPILGSQAGILCVRGHITARQLSTVDYVARVYGRFEFYQAPGRRQAQSPSYQAGYSRSAGSGAQNEIAAAGASAEFHQLQRIIDSFPLGARDVLERLCIDDSHIPQLLLPGLIVVLETIDREVRGEPEPDVDQPRKPKLEERIASGAFVWRAEGVSGPGTAKGSEAKILSMLGRLETRKELT